jgi:hypothetical protein
MKTRNTFVLAIVAASLASTTQAALVRYTFTGSQVNEQYQNYSMVPPHKRVFVNGTPVSITFFYDSSAPATATNFAPNTVGTGSNFGYMSKYDAAVQQFSGTIAGHQFSAAAGRGLVSDATPSQSGMRDGVFFGAGTPDLNFPAIAGSNFQGFQTGQFTLVGLNLWRVGQNSYLSNQSLPNSLTGPGANSGLYLTFVNASQQQIWAQFGGSFTVTPVPVPAAAWLFGSALAGLAGARLRKNRNR